MAKEYYKSESKKVIDQVSDIMNRRGEEFTEVRLYKKGDIVKKAPEWFIAFEKKNDARWEENNKHWEKQEEFNKNQELFNKNQELFNKNQELFNKNHKH